MAGRRSDRKRKYSLNASCLQLQALTTWRCVLRDTTNGNAPGGEGVLVCCWASSSHSKTRFFYVSASAVVVDISRQKKKKSLTNHTHPRERKKTRLGAWARWSPQDTSRLTTTSGVVDLCQYLPRLYFCVPGSYSPFSPNHNHRQGS